MSMTKMACPQCGSRKTKTVDAGKTGYCKECNYEGNTEAFIGAAMSTAKSQHTPGPLHCITSDPKAGKILGDETAFTNSAQKLTIHNHNCTVATVYRAPDAARIRACWNACEGIANPEAVGELVEALKGVMEELWSRRTGDVRKDFSLLNAHACASKALHKAGVK